MQIRREASASSLLRYAACTLTLSAIAACADAPVAPEGAASAGDIAGSLSASGSSGSEHAGAVYISTNGASANAVVAFRRAEDGALSPLGTFATGGRGIGGGIDPLVSQFAVIVNETHDALFAVDAGSNQVSSFRIDDAGVPVRVGSVSSRGTLPVSVATHGNLLYVLNAGDNTLAGFRVTNDARLVPLPFARRSLAAGANGAAAVRFTPDGKYLIVTERVSNRLEVFAVSPSGGLGEPTLTASSGSAAFGFDITSRNQPIVSETQGSLTSYALQRGGSLSQVTSSISTNGNAPCWVTITSDGRFAYVTNSASGTVAGFAIDDDGTLTALAASATGSTGAGSAPLDLDHVGTRFIYTLEAGRGAIGTFAIDDDGALHPRADTPAGAAAAGLQGIAAF